MAHQYIINKVSIHWQLRPMGVENQLRPWMSDLQTSINTDGEHTLLYVEVSYITAKGQDPSRAPSQQIVYHEAHLIPGYVLIAVYVPQIIHHRQDTLSHIRTLFPVSQTTDPKGRNPATNGRATGKEVH